MDLGILLRSRRLEGWTDLGAQSTLNSKSYMLIVDTMLGRVDVIATSPTIQDLILVSLVDATEVFYVTPSLARYALTDLNIERDGTLTNSKKTREFLQLPWLSLPFQDSTILTITTVCCYCLMSCMCRAFHYSLSCGWIQFANDDHQQQGLRCAQLSYRSRPKL